MKSEEKIIDRKQMEERLRESEQKYRLLVNNLPGVVYKGYKDWSVEFFDRKIELLTGYDVNEFNARKMKWSDIIVNKDVEAAREHFIEALETDKSYLREYRIRSKTGDIHWIQERGQIVCDNKGDME
jgi:PAS domain S-box-containing protein